MAAISGGLFRLGGIHRGHAAVGHAQERGHSERRDAFNDAKLDDPTSDAMDDLNRLARDITRTLSRDIGGEFVFRVDTRLRPYGDAGPMVPTLDFIEQYFVAQGRMWERLALANTTPWAISPASATIFVRSAARMTGGCAPMFS